MQLFSVMRFCVADPYFVASGMEGLAIEEYEFMASCSDAVMGRHIVMSPMHPVSIIGCLFPIRGGVAHQD